MANMLWLLLTVVLLVVAVIARLLLSRKAQGNLPLPPGPKGLPLVGNINDLPPPGEIEFKHWLKHKDQYGPFSSITVLGTTMVIIHGKDLAFELMDKRANIHSGRPVLTFSFNMIGWINTISGLQLGPMFRQYRKYSHQQLGSKGAVSKYHPVQEAAVGRCIWRINRDGGANLNQHLKTEAAEIMLNMLYGYNIEPHASDLLASKVEDAMSQFAQAAVPGRWAVDQLPFLEHLPDWMPGTEFKRIARRWKQTLEDVANMPYDFAKTRGASSTGNVSFVCKSIEQSQMEKGEKRLTAEEEHAIKWVAASLYTGGSDTSVSTMESWFLAMSMFPDVQRKAQEEIDRVVGSSRLPTFSDRENLPYLEAIKVDEINGYRIPKGAILLPAVHWFTRDPAVYHDPESFKPERFSKPYSEPYATVTFGFGRRVCPGRVLADSSLFLTFAQSLAVFNIQKALDDSGKEIEPTHGYRDGVIAYPTPFRVKVWPRSDAHARLIAKVIEDHPWPESDAKCL